jgi:hypothetical protein
MKKHLTIGLFFMAIISYGQTAKFTFDWKAIQNNDNLPQREAAWLNNNLTANELKEVIDLVSALSQPAASQMLVSHFYLDASFSRASIKPYIDSLKVRPPDGDAGIIRVAYLVSKLRKKLIKNRRSIKSNKIYTAEFSGAKLEVPEFKKTDINRNIELSFDFQPAQVILNLLSEPNSNYHEILSKLNLPQFDALVQHRSQSFYYTTTSKERLATCLEIASSTKPLDELYKYMNPYGLLNFTDVKTHLKHYKQQIKELSDNEEAILNYINARISPYLPSKAEFKRKISFFFISDADGWASSNVVAVDLNYFKNDYDKLLNLLVHETYHGGQNAVSINDSTKREDNVQLFIDVLDYLFAEGTATHVAPPKKKTNLEKENAINNGIQILEEIYSNTIINYDIAKTTQLINKGIANSGPFYWLGAEMSRVIVNENGKEELTTIIPKGGIAFLKSYMSAVKKSKITKNMFNKSFTNYLKNLK